MRRRHQQGTRGLEGKPIMIEVICQCAKPRKMPASAIGKRFLCPACKQTLQIVSAEPLEDGGGDFDASLTILSGPADVGTKILLGGVVDIEIGKLPERHLSLHGPQVSRQHCKLVRLDFAPSRWRLVDTGSTHGVFVNQDRIADY